MKTHTFHSKHPWLDFFAPTAVALCVTLLILCSVLFPLRMNVRRVASAAESPDRTVAATAFSGAGRNTPRQRSGQPGGEHGDSQPLPSDADGAVRFPSTPDDLTAAAPDTRTAAAIDDASATDSAFPVDGAMPPADPATSADETASQAALPDAANDAMPQTDSAPFEYLPVIHRGGSDARRIAITVDDCYQMDNLKTIARLAHKHGGRLTLFPIGQNVERDGMDQILQTCVFKLGFEIENHTWSHARIFRLSEEEMADEIWKQRAAVNRALGVNYEQHFFRLMGGDGKNDQRTHSYLKQLGYRAIADWTISGSNADMDQLHAALAPGAVFLFHTTDEDTATLKKFIPYAVKQGYELVTLNELLGYPENAVSDLSTFDGVRPAPAPFAPDYRELKEGDYSWATLQLQRCLLALGYLSPDADTATEGNPADGVYGTSTALAVQAFQRDAGLPATGIADGDTQRRLLSGDT